MSIKTNSLRFKITFIFIALSLLAGTVMGAVIYVVTSRSITAEVYHQLEAAADSRGNHIAEHLENDLVTISALSKNGRLNEELLKDEPSMELLQQIVEEEIKNYPNFIEMIILDKGGNIAVSGDRAKIGLDRSSDEVFTGALSGKVYFKDIYKSQVGGRAEYAVSAPILSRSGKVLGVIAGIGDASKLNEIVKDDTGMGKTGEIYLVNKDMVAITPTRLQGDKILFQKVQNDGIRESLSGRDVMGIFNDYRGKKVLAHYNINEHLSAVIGVNWCVAAEMDMAEAYEPIYRLRNIFLLLFVFYLIAVGFAGVLVANNVARPIEALSGASAKIA
ncbi:MAG TPA: cache domain-containing protein, partial [Candidatus Omnitrophota bacterium]|nr:cache domain-containing protein [Candidatus Omnitrophota bacterium]